jgi:hypothetical protein
MVKATSTHWIESWWTQSQSGCYGEQKNILPLQEYNPDSSVTWPIVCHCTTGAMIISLRTYNFNIT